MNENKQTFRGIIGWGNCGPQQKTITTENGETRNIMYFTLLYHDKTWKKDGVRHYNRKFLKVFLMNNKHGEAQFKNLYPMRQVEVTGTLSVSTFFDGKKNLTSLNMNDADITFISKRVEDQVDSMLEIASKKGLINSENNLNCSVEEFKKSIINYVKHREDENKENEESEQGAGF